MLQKLCPDSFNSVGIWKNKDALMCSLSENQLKSIDILESKLEHLKEEVGPILKEEDKDLSQNLLKNLYPNEFVNGIF